MPGRPHIWAILVLVIPMVSGCWVTKYEWCGWLGAPQDSGDEPSIFDNGGRKHCTTDTGTLSSLDEVIEDGENEGQSYQWRQVAAGTYATCGLTIAGNIHCWGKDVYGILDPPSGVFEHITMNEYTGCGLKANGSAVCWGDNDKGVAQPATGTFSQIDLNLFFGCGLPDDGFLDCWGVGERPFLNDTQVEPVVQFTTLDDSPTCGVTTSGTIECWCHTVRLPHMDTRSICESVTGGGFKEVAVSDSRGCGLTNEGSLRCWGEGAEDEPTNVTFNTIEFGEHDRCGLQTDGTLTCWADSSSPPSGTYTQVSIGYQHSCAVTTDNKIRCWGSNSNGESTPP